MKSILDAGKINYEGIKVDTFKKEHRSAKIVKMNPNGAIPFISVNG